jgi:hypothetical protein
VTNIELELEVDIKPSEADAVAAGYHWKGEGEFEGIEIDFRPPQGHGFGLTVLATIAITIGSGVATDLLTDAIKAAILGTVRRARSHKHDKTTTDAMNVDQSEFDLLAKPLQEAVNDAIADVDAPPK